jgi:hypothetical protein
LSANHAGAYKANDQQKSEAFGVHRLEPNERAAKLKEILKKENQWA